MHGRVYKRQVLENIFTYVKVYNMTQNINQAIVNSVPRIARILNADVRVVTMFILEYAKTHGDESILGLNGFLNYAEKSNLDKEEVFCTISHDLHGRLDKLMLPRTYDYAQFS